MRPGEAGAKQTLGEMTKLALEGSQSLPVRTLAMELTRGLPQKDYRREACTLLRYCRDRIRYVRDIYSVEVLQTPDITVQVGGGDCDDKSILLAALLASIGHRARFIAIAFLPGQYSHVWVQAFIDGEWLDLEPTEPIVCGKRVPTKGVYKSLTCEL